MTHKQYYAVVSEISNYTDRDAFISDLALSSMCGLDPDPSDTAEGVGSIFDSELSDIAEDVGRIWDAYHMSINELRAVTGLSQAAFANRFLVPRRTLESWESKSASGRECPAYTRMMIADLLGLLPARTNE